MNASERKRIVAEGDAFRSLLGEFKAILSGFGNGVSFFPLNPKSVRCEGRGKYVYLDYVQLDSDAWRWIKPLLEELRDYRLNDASRPLPPAGPDVAFIKYVEGLRAAAYAEWKEKLDAMLMLTEYPSQTKCKKAKKKKCKKHLPIDRKDSKGRPIKKCSYCCLVLKKEKKRRKR